MSVDMEVIMMNPDILNKDKAYISYTYPCFLVAIRCGKGSTAEDLEGNRYIDFGSGIGTNSLRFYHEGGMSRL